MRWRLPVWWCVMLFVLQQFSVVQAQYLTDDLDIDPPVIDHESLETGLAGEPQFFSVKVIDDRGVGYVDLYYRDSANSDYAKAAMQASGNTDEYTVTIETLIGQSKVEYYIEAGDNGGNRVLKGFPFYPLLRNLESPAAASLAANRTTTAEPSGGSRLLYILVGALAVGLLASASSGDDSGGGGGGGENQVPLTINISSPAD